MRPALAFGLLRFYSGVLQAHSNTTDKKGPQRKNNNRFVCRLLPAATTAVVALLFLTLSAIA